VLLLDFGLAAAEGSERLTGTGAQMGSLAWMSPEQVRGEHAGLDARTDVYSLGATLYELLTLRSPFTGGDTEATRQRILQGQLIPLRDLNAAVPRDAETVCLHAMDVERERRYAGAGDFAADLDNVLALRPVSARRPGAMHKARRWAQRNPARAVASLLGAVLLVGGPAGYGVLESRAAAEQRRLNDELTLGREELQRSLAEATRQREASERGYKRTLTAIDQMLWQVGSEDLRDLPGFEDTRIALLERALSFYRELASEQPGDTVPRLEHARTQRSIADILLELERRDEAAALFAEVVATLRELHAAEPGDVVARHMLAGCLSQVGIMQQQGQRLDAARATLGESLALLEELVARPEPDPSWLRDHAVVCVNLAQLANDSGDDEEELRLDLRAIDTGTRLVAEHPESLDYAVQLAAALKNAATAGLALGHVEESESRHRTAWAMLARLRIAHPRDRALRTELVECATNFGLMLMSRPDRTEALAVLREGLAAAASLAQDFPRDPVYRKNAAAIGLNLSAELGNQKRFAEAAPLIEDSCAQLAGLVADEPDSVEYGYFLGAALSVASGMHLSLGDRARALSEAGESVARLRAVRAALGDSTEVAGQLASALFQRADVERASRTFPVALATCEEACALGGQRPDILFQGAEITGHLAADALDAGADAAVAGDTDADRVLSVTARAEELCLALLDEAVSKGFGDAPRLRDAVFASLQGEPAFEELVARLGAVP
ncbi:MAG TPA: protein kinase, partial [Planctomycetota bacterium]|nr:protein kinase [Planctomycetota bacterium]